MRFFATYLIGLLFGIGIVTSGMSNPAKVLNFFDLAGTWDPSLAFVMAGAIFVTFLGYQWVFQRKAPLLDSEFALPSNKAIDWKLVIGAIIFGIGWGLAGFCPGGAIPVLGTGQAPVFIFVSALLVGMYLTRFVTKSVQEKTMRQHLSDR